jgi:hypothetical protein
VFVGPLTVRTNRPPTVFALLDLVSAFSTRWTGQYVCIAHFVASVVVFALGCYCFGWIRARRFLFTNPLDLFPPGPSSVCRIWTATPERIEITTHDVVSAVVIFRKAMLPTKRSPTVVATERMFYVFNTVVATMHSGYNRPRVLDCYVRESSVVPSLAGNGN